MFVFTRNACNNYNFDARIIPSYSNFNFKILQKIKLLSTYIDFKKITVENQQQ